MVMADFPDVAPIPEMAAIDRATFETDIVPAGEAVVLRGQVGNWPLVTAGKGGSQALAETLGGISPDTRVRTFSQPATSGSRFFYADDFKSLAFDINTPPLADLLQRLIALETASEPEAVFAGGVPLTGGMAPVATAQAISLLPPETERLVSLWIGNRTRTAPHWDLPQNLAGVIAGRRRFLLFPIEQIANLYVGPLDFTLAGQPISLVDPRQPDADRFPRFAEAMRHARQAVLEPGDMLYMPAMQVHYVESLDPFSMMLNIWWRDGPEHLATPFMTLLHGLLTLRGMPPRERQAWKVLFDRYLFQDDEDPMDHLPGDARGLFGEPTPETLARIKAIIGRSLNR